MLLIRGNVHKTFKLSMLGLNLQFKHRSHPLKNLLPPIRHNIVTFLHELCKIFFKDNIFDIFQQLFFGFNVTVVLFSLSLNLTKRELYRI
jgi:hypothetical protein